MEGDFGTFMLLTGMPVTGNEALKMGMAELYVQYPETYHQEAIQVMKDMENAFLLTSDTVLRHSAEGGT